MSLFLSWADRFRSAVRMTTDWKNGWYDRNAFVTIFRSFWCNRIGTKYICCDVDNPKSISTTTPRIKRKNFLICAFTKKETIPHQHPSLSLLDFPFFVQSRPCSLSPVDLTSRGKVWRFVCFRNRSDSPCVFREGLCGFIRWSLQDRRERPKRSDQEQNWKQKEGKRKVTRHETIEQKRRSPGHVYLLRS